MNKIGTKAISKPMNRYTYTTKVSFDIITKDGIESDYRKFVSNGEAIRFKNELTELNPLIRNCTITPIDNDSADCE